MKRHHDDDRRYCQFRPQGAGKLFPAPRRRKAGTVYEMVIKSVERPMLEVVLKQAGGNQTLAAEILGINRNTLRKKLVDHRLIA
jgi:DNA-binding NtrC family response regulator